ncbi:RNA exonuclease 5-like isoform X2 [Brienomyrus brachyistius]|uniref:RNA exonuclease 5-like isoform X2 n=1 Tax=Brienomyrus brachyistius TaxID=42636 RepID=UPI0020B3D622|nr:RNA exonuclease 5-like isoform X2 [Brienomyrus brachyistius]
MAVANVLERKRKSAESPTHNGCAKNPRKSQTKSVPRLKLTFRDLHGTITQQNLNELLLFASLGKTYSLKQPDWCRLHHQKNVCAVNVTVLEGLTQLHFYRYYLQFKNLRKLYNIRCSFISPAGNVLSEILSTELCNFKNTSSVLSISSSELEKTLGSKENDLSWHPVIRKYVSESQGLTAYLLSPDEMSRMSFPQKDAPGCESFLCTQSDGHVTDGSPLFGLDCEMCVTVCGTELTRVSLVDSSGHCLLDELVKPENRILNYLTRYSGITKAMLKPVSTRLSDVQAKVIQALPHDAVLVGHSLENDLRALKLIHQHVIDTSVLYHRKFGQKFKLKFLAEAVLNRQIQQEGRQGHDPTEDALAALDLAQHFIGVGPQKVAALDLDAEWKRRQPKKNSANGALANKGVDSISFGDALKAAGLSAVHLGEVAESKGLGVPVMQSRVQCNSDREVLSASRSETQGHFFSTVRFSSLAERARVGLQEKRLADHLHRMAEMCMIYAGPLPRDCTVQSVQRLFRRCGPVRSVTLQEGMQSIHAMVEFEMLEGAYLAVKSLNGHELHGRPIRVQRPVKESTLDLEVALGELEADALFSNVLYVARVTEPLLCPTFSQFGQIEGVVLPGRSPPANRRKDAFIKFESSEGIQAALSSGLQAKGREVMMCRALTPWHLPSWAGHVQQSSEHQSTTEETSATPGGRDDPDQQAEECEMKSLIRKLDRKVAKLFQALPDKTLSVLLLPGLRSTSADLQGLCLISVKSDSHL